MQPAVQPAHGVMERAYRTSRVVCRRMQYLEGRVAGGSWKFSKEKITKYSFRKHTVWERLKDFVIFLDYFSKASSKRSPFEGPFNGTLWWLIQKNLNIQILATLAGGIQRLS